MIALPSGVKATTGGKFNRDESFQYFIATNATALTKVDYPHVLVAVNEIVSAKDHEALDYLCDNRNVMLDSGIFNLAMTHARNNDVSHDTALSLSPEEIDGFDRLWEQYGSVARKYADRLWGVVELDQGGIENKPRTRARIESEFGITPIPVYHPLLDGWDYYDDLASEYDRICFGNLVQGSASMRARIAHTASERAKRYPYLWTHLLGVTPWENILAVPLRGSCDSSSWLTAMRWYPSWRGKSMLKSTGKYPPPMWPNTEIVGADGKAMNHTGHMNRPLQVVQANTRAIQITLDEMREDTHPWHP